MTRRPKSPPDSAARGAAGEEAAARLLRRLGYRLVARNLRTTEGEIDLLVTRRRTLVAVEVKTRRHHPAPERAVTPEQYERLRRAVTRVSRTQRGRAPRDLRVDVVAVRWRNGEPPEVRHFPGDSFPAV